MHSFSIYKTREDLKILFFIRGFIVGFLINAPVGPIGILCIRRSFTEGRTVGFISGLGVATVDAIYGLVAGFGLTFISNFKASSAGVPVDFRFANFKILLLIQALSNLFMTIVQMQNIKTLIPKFRNNYLFSNTFTE